MPPTIPSTPVNSLRIERLQRDGAERLHLAGDITEAARFEEIGALGAKIAIDLAGIRRFNSYGVRSWLQFIRAASQKTEIVFENCPSAFIGQVNMIVGFLGNGRIASFFAPYYCRKCARAVDIFVQATPDLDPHKLPNEVCGECQSPLVFDDLEDVYFAFLRRGAAEP